MSRGATIADVLEGRARWAVAEGDCLSIMSTMPAASVDHTITDPPYEAQAHTLQRRVRDPGADKGASESRSVVDLPLSFESLTEDVRNVAAIRISRLTRRWASAFCQVEAAVRWTEALRDAGMVGKRIGVWIKPDAMPQFTGDRPGMGYESIAFCHQPGRSRWNGGGRVAVFTHNKNSGGAHDHETQKPLPLMLELVELFTDPDEIILDPFCGSGTTGVACIRLGRRFIGIEKKPEYAELSRERLEAESKGLTLRAARAGQLPMFGDL